MARRQRWSVHQSTKGIRMAKGFFSRGFLGRRRDPEQAARLPPGQYLTDGFPVLSAGPTPYTPKDRWDFTVVGVVETPQRWTWDEFQALPRQPITADIHCVTKWSKFDSKWSGFSLDTILNATKITIATRLRSTQPQVTRSRSPSSQVRTGCGIL